MSMSRAEIARQESLRWTPSKPVAPQPSKWMTRREVAEEFRVTEDTVTEFVDKGILIAYRLGGQLRYKRADVDAAFQPVEPKADGTKRNGVQK